MSIVEPGPATSGLVERVKAILLRPGQTWDVIEPETATTAGLYKGYIAPLAAIPAVCGLLGALTIGFGFLGFGYRPSLSTAVGQAVLGYALSLAQIFILSLVIDALAPNFGGQRDKIQALKLAAYAATASWIAGVFSLLPTLAGIAAVVGGLYSLYTLYLGLPKLMKNPSDKTTPYFVVILVVAIVISLVIGALTASLVRFSGPITLASKPQGTLILPGAATVNLGELDKTTKELTAAAEAIQSGEGGASDPESLKAYLPDAVIGYRRTEVSSSSSGVGGISGSNAEGVYVKGPARFTLSVVDMGEAGKLAGLADVLNVQSSKEDGAAYEKVGKVDGRFTQESFDKGNGHGEYSVMVGKRFMVQASGEGAPMNDLKAAVKSVSLDRLETVAKAG